MHGFKSRIVMLTQIVTVLILTGEESVDFFDARGDLMYRSMVLMSEAT